MLFTLYNGIKVVGKIPGQGDDLRVAVEAVLGVL